MKHKHKREKYLILIHFDKIRRSKSPTEFQGEIQMIEHHKKQQIIAMKSNRSNWLSSNWFKPGNKPNNYWYKSLIQAKPSVTSWKLIGIALWARRRFDEKTNFLQYWTQWIFVFHPYCVYFLIKSDLAIIKNDQVFKPIRCASPIRTIFWLLEGTGSNCWCFLSQHINSNTLPVGFAPIALISVQFAMMVRLSRGARVELSDGGQDMGLYRGLKSHLFCVCVQAWMCCSESSLLQVTNISNCSYEMDHCWFDDIALCIMTLKRGESKHCDWCYCLKYYDAEAKWCFYDALSLLEIDWNIIQSGLYLIRPELIYLFGWYITQDGL